MAGFEHVRQRFSWDCGLACVEMSLRALGPRPAASSVMDATPRTVWTIDLLLLLEQELKGANKLRYSTACAGPPPPSHFELSFYARSPGDAQRVPLAFAEAAAKGLAVREEAADLAVVAAELATGAAVFIALVDYRLLRCTACGNGGSGSSYQGHYVLLVACHDGELQYLDPAAGAPSGGCACTMDAFAAAWSAEGTDKDLIRVARD
jgi:hypothetical protein